MRREARGLMAIGCLLALLSGGCAQDATSGTEAPPVAARQKAVAKEVAGGAGGAKTSSNAAPSGDSSSVAADDENGVAQGSGAPGAGSGEDGDPIAFGASETVDDGTDRTGAGPGYGEMTRAAVEGHGDLVTFSVQVADAFPRRLPRDSNMILGIGLQEDAEHGAVAVIAQGTAAGWTAVIQDDGGSRGIKDWSLDGDTITWTVPWEWIDGPREFTWGASLQIFNFNTDAGAASDKAPNSGPQAFPAG